MARIGLIIAVFFLICQTMNAIINILTAVREDDTLSTWLWVISYLLLTMNSSSNFLIYFLSSGDVKKKLGAFLCV